LGNPLAGGAYGKLRIATMPLFLLTAKNFYSRIGKESKKWLFLVQLLKLNGIF
jgi:hypothetical protein